MVAFWELSRVLTGLVLSLKQSPEPVTLARGLDQWGLGGAVTLQGVKWWRRGHRLPLVTYDQALGQQDPLTPDSFQASPQKHPQPHPNNVMNFSSLMNFKVF